MFLDLLKQPTIEAAALSQDVLTKLKTAEKEIEKGIVSGMWVFGSTFVIAMIAIFAGKSVLGIDAYALVDAFIFAILTYGLYIKNRFSAWALLSLFVIEKVSQIASLSNTVSTPSVFFYVSIIVFIGFCYGVKGIQTWHKILDENKVTTKQKGFELKQTFLLIGIGVIIFILAAVVYIAKDTGGENVLGANQQNQLSPSSEIKDFNFVSTADGFKAVFPTQPSRSEETSDTGTEGTVKTVSYTSQKGGSKYFVFIYTYDDARMSEDNPKFSSTGAMEGAINGMANQEGAKLLSSKEITVSGRNGYRYKIEISNETLDGVIVYRGNRMYNTAVNYLTKDGAPSDTEKYLNTFELN